MSFFASAFAPSGSGSGSSLNPFKAAASSSKQPQPQIVSSAASSSSTGSSKKRKRPSNGDDASKRELAQSGQVNLERLMKKVGMVGNANGSRGSNGDGEIVVGKGRERNVQRDEAAENPRPSVFQEEVAGGPRQKKQKVKVGLDGRPTNQAKSTDVGLPPPGSRKSKAKSVEASSVQPSETKHGVAPSPVPSPTNKINGNAPMTKLQSTLSSRLDSAKFRWINEQLYTRESGEAWEMMKRDGGGAFKDYHKSHRHQTAAWPSPPLPLILSLLRPLPAGTLIVDLGCGDAGLAKALQGTGKKVLSFDLVGDLGVESGENEDEDEDVDGVTGGFEEEAGDPEGSKRGGKAKEGGDRGRGWVVPCDFLNHVPLPGHPGGVQTQSSIDSSLTTALGNTTRKTSKKAHRSGGTTVETGGQARPEIVDVIVCCLSLMGINWVGGIHEACRILKRGGKLHIAEVTSRLISKEGFVQTVESFGFTLDERSSPTTHFDLLQFTKTSAQPLGPVRGQRGWGARVRAGQAVMKGCAYKKR